MGCVQPVKIVKMVQDWDWSVRWVPLGYINGENSENGEHNLPLYLGSVLCTPSVKGEKYESGLRYWLRKPTKIQKMEKIVWAYGCGVGCVLPA